MKTCPMCGTLLFDDATKCTKCDKDLKPEESEAPANEAAGEASAVAAGEATQDTESSAAESSEGSGEATAESASADAETPAADTATGEPQLIESAVKRKKWLDEQEKIKAELANIMGRVGKKKKPLVQPQQMAPAPTPVPTPTANVSPVTPVTPFTPAQAQSPAPMPTATTPQEQQAAPAQEGLSEFDKKELKRELDDLRNEGYNVSRLERIIEESPGTAWKAFSEFLDDIENLNQQKARLEQINTTGYDTFTARKNEILGQMTDPDLLSEFEGVVTSFENDFLAAKSQPMPQTVEPSMPEPEEDNKLAKYINAGKNAFRDKNFEKAKKFFDRAFEIEPNNREVVFFRKKIEAKFAGPGAEEVEFGAEPVPADEGLMVEPSKGKKKKKKKKKMVSHRDAKGAPGVPAQAAGAPVPAPAPVAAVDPAMQQPVQAVQPVPQQVQVQPQPTPQPQQQAAAPQPAAAGGAGNGSPVGVDDGPRTAAEFEALGFNAYINKDYPKALEFYEKVLEIDPNFPGVESIRNECLMRLGKA